MKFTGKERTYLVWALEIAEDRVYRQRKRHLHDAEHTPNREIAGRRKRDAADAAESLSILEGIRERIESEV